MGLHPVEQVSWNDCTEVADRLGLVLPTEAQWEYAARAGTSSVYFTGHDLASLDGAANLADAYAKANGGPSGWVYEEEFSDGYTVHAPIGRFEANRFGLHDVHGNVWEWCRDRYGPYNFPADPTTGERQVSAVRLRVFRGGGFAGPATYLHSAFRLSNPPVFRDIYLGVRFSRLITE